MPTSKIEPLRPVIRLLAIQLQKQFPKVVPFDDRQPWEWSPLIGCPPGMFALVAAIDSGGQETPWETLLDFSKVTAKVIHVEGPPRLFLSGWDMAEGRPVCVSAPLFREVLDDSPK